MPNTTFKGNSDTSLELYRPRVHRHAFTTPDATADPFVFSLPVAAYNSVAHMNIAGFSGQQQDVDYSIDATGTQVTIENHLRDLLSVGKIIELYFSEVI